MFGAWILLIIGSCTAEIYHLNDSEYACLPPLWSMEPYAACMEAGGTYCVMQLHLTAAPQNQLMHTIQEYSAYTIKHYNHSVVERGVCASTTCTEYIGNAENIEELYAPLESCLEEWSRTWGLRAHVHDVQCTRGARDQPDSWDWTVLAVLLALVSLNMAGTVYHYYYVTKPNVTQSKIGNKYLLSFSVSRNWERLTNMNFRDPKSEDLQFLHGARVVAQFCTILMHVLTSLATGFLSNPHDVEKTFGRVPYYLIYNGMMIVQVFFFISGLLTCYIAMQAAEENSNRTVTVWDLLKVLLIRLSRLLPALAMTVALVTSWLRHLGSGPLWPRYVTNSLVAQCRDNWWHHLLFINNYTNRGNFCLIQTWHLAADLQVFIVALLAYVVSRRVLVPMLLLLSIVAPAVHTVLQDLEAIFVTPQFLRTWDSPTFWGQHVLGHTNLACFILGMMTASKLYEWKKRGGHLVTSRWWSALQYLSLALIPTVMISGGIYYGDTRAAPWSRAVYSSLVRLLLSGACALIAFSFVNRSTSSLKSLFEWRGWVVPSRLTYCVFLLHMPFIHIMMGYRTELVYYSFNNVMLSTAFIIPVSLAAAVILHLSVEAPFIALFKAAAKLDTNKAPAPASLHKKDGKIKATKMSDLPDPYTNGKSKHL